jgi:hypothetical protein
MRAGHKPERNGAGRFDKSAEYPEAPLDKEKNIYPSPLGRYDRPTLANSFSAGIASTYLLHFFTLPYRVL